MPLLWFAFVAVIKHTTKSNLGEKRTYLNMDPEGQGPSWRGRQGNREAWCQKQETSRSHFHPHTGRRERKQEVR